MTTHFATDVSPIVIDIETCGLPNAEFFLEPIPDAVPDDSPIEADKRLTDPAKIAADLERKRAARIEQNDAAQVKVEQQRQARIERTALDWNVGRIAAMGWWTESGGIDADACRCDGDEAVMLQAFWELARHRTIVGFNIKGFDLKFMIQRSRYLGVTYPMLDLGKYAKQGIRDLYLDLTFNDGTYDQGAMRRTLKAFCERFGIPVTDEIDGKEIPTLVAAGEWGKVTDHVIADVQVTVALAKRLGVIAADVPAEAMAI